MKRIVRLTESDLARIVRRVINEGATDVQFAEVSVRGLSVASIFAPNEVKVVNGLFYNFSQNIKGKLLSATVTPTELGKKLGLTADNLKITMPAVAPLMVPGKGEKTPYMVNGTTRTIMEGTKGSYSCTFKAPSGKWVNSSGKSVALFDIAFSTNDRYLPTQTVSFYAGVNTQFGNSAASGN
jgi:hypothetical protein